MYGPEHVLRLYKNEQERPVRDYLHVILHCIYSHMFIGDIADRRLWDLACDIAVESTINDLGTRVTWTSRQDLQRSETEKLRHEVKLLTAEKIYHYYRENGISDLEADRLRRLFEADDHSGWYKPESCNSRDHKKTEEGRNLLRDEENEVFPADSADGENIKNELLQRRPLEEAGEEWRKIAEKIQEDLETFSREQGDTSGVLTQNLKEVNRERYDYTSFLRKFSVYGETMTVNDEEFDYIYYTYGLKLYENMPLVEPLEYKEVKRIKEFVIAVDTSGSTSGELVQRFLQKTYNILKTTESYFSRVNIHIIQCDAAIQEHVKISCEEEFDSYISTMSIKGLGGTDFRPVFDLVDRLMEEGEIADLKGLIYFTDGRGTFPARKPEYETAFIFLDNEYNDPDVPPWAIRLVLQNEDI
jgi:predicted metal-dependent peptidase